MRSNFEVMEHTKEDVYFCLSEGKWHFINLSSLKIEPGQLLHKKISAVQKGGEWVDIRLEKE